MAKIFTWQGKTEQEIQTMDLKEFMKLIPSRQRRTLKRGFSEQQKKLLNQVEIDNKNIKSNCRNMIIVTAILGKLIKVHNGKDYLPITITVEMLGHYLGEFAHTRKMVSHSSAGVGATRSSKAISAR